MIIYLDKDFNPVDKSNSIMAKVFPEDGSPPYFIETDKIDLKSIDTYDRQLWKYALDLYRGGDSGVFITDFVNAISNQLNRAWREGAAEMGVTHADMTDDDRNEIQAIINAEYEHILDLGTAITAAQHGTIQEFRDTFRARIDMWVNRYTDVKNQAKIYFGGKTRLEWVEGDTLEKCPTCLALNGIVAFASEWEQSGVHPQGAPNQALICGGWNCGCSLQPTDKRRSPNALQRIMDIATAANVGKSYNPDQPRDDIGRWTDTNMTFRKLPDESKEIKEGNEVGRGGFWLLPDGRLVQLEIGFNHSQFAMSFYRLNGEDGKYGIDLSKEGGIRIANWSGLDFQGHEFNNDKLRTLQDLFLSKKMKMRDFDIDVTFEDDLYTNNKTTIFTFGEFISASEIVRNPFTNIIELKSIIQTDEKDLNISIVGFDDCIIGEGESFKSHHLIYDRSLIINKLLADGMDVEEAQEYIDINIISAYVGKNMPIIIDKE